MMAAVSARRSLLPLTLVVAVCASAHAQAGAPAPSGATAAWTVRVNGDRTASGTLVSYRL